MPKKTDEQLMHERLIEASRTVRLYAGTEGYKHLIEMLDTLGRSYMTDLVNVSPDGLVSLQAAIKQTYAIRAIVANEGQDVPKI
jgi:hypothetical protein